MKSTPALFSKKFSLKIFVFIALLAVSVVTFFLIFAVTTTSYQHAYLWQSERNTRALSNQLAASLLQLMEKGWSRESMNRFLQPYIEDRSEVPLIVTMYRSASVQDLFGRIDPEVWDDEIQQAMLRGKSLSSKENRVIKEVVAVLAEPACLKCHSNARQGETLGVFRIEQDLRPTLMAIFKKIALLFIILSPLPVLTAALISRYTTKKIERSTALLRQSIKKVNRVQDLTTVRFNDNGTDFSELNQILEEVNTLVGKMKDVAIDKELLVFQVQLLEAFLITSDVIRDWKDHVGKLLLRVNEIIDIYALFSIFQVGRETYAMEIFWHSPPTQETKERFNHIVKQRIGKLNRLHFLAGMEINHNIIDKERSEVELNEQDIDLEVKSIFLESPQIGGVVGIGLQSSTVARDVGRSLIIEGILTTLANVVGSVKAIDQYTREVKYYVTRDPLTELYNQSVFWDLAANEQLRARRHEQKFALLVIDFDNFKMINDRYGHAFGNSFLQRFARQMKDVLPEGDILARYSGDIFTAILPQTNQESAHQTAGRVMDALKDVVMSTTDGLQIKATVSIGIALFPDHADDINTLFVIARNMMLRAKAEGKNRIGIPCSDDLVEARLATDEKGLFLLNLLENPENIIPYFQPIVGIQQHDVSINELLMAVRSGEEIIRASSFIGTAEKMGIISRLDYIVIEKAFKEIRDKGYQGLLFVNLAPNSLILKEFVHDIRKLATDYQVEPSQVVFEITERETVRNRVLLEQFVWDLKNEGFKFAIDDFGSGFSTYHYLKMFPIDYVKIDGEFIKNTPAQEVDRAFVKSMISLAKDLKIKTIAEFIEDSEILKVARELGADYGQGYFIGRPSLAIEPSGKKRPAVNLS